MAAVRASSVLFVFLSQCVHVSLSVECPNGFVTHENSCYSLLHESYNWFEGETACRSMEARLVEIDSAGENQFVVELARSHGVTDVWTGINDFAEEGVFVNPSSHTKVPVSFWAHTEPDDYLGHQDCARIIVSSGLWDDTDCHDYSYPVVCEMTRGVHEFAVVG